MGPNALGPGLYNSTLYSLPALIFCGRYRWGFHSSVLALFAATIYTIMQFLYLSRCVQTFVEEVGDMFRQILIRRDKCQINYRALRF
jgi:hypothetical protein